VAALVEPFGLVTVLRHEGGVDSAQFCANGANLKPGECRYIAGEASALAAYCASPTQDGSPWCRTHAQIVLAQP
jgi:hypothetical protein